MKGNETIAIGGHGEIVVHRTLEGWFVADAQFRDWDGVMTPVSALSSRRNTAVETLKGKLAARSRHVERRTAHYVAHLEEKETRSGNRLSTKDAHRIRHAVGRWVTGNSRRGPKSDPGMLDIVDLVLTTPLSIGAVLRLRWWDVTFAEDSTSVEVSSYALPTYVAAALRDRRDRCRPQQGAYIFAARTGSSYRVDNIQRRWHSICDAEHLGIRVREGLGRLKVAPSDLSTLDDQIRRPDHDVMVNLHLSVILDGAIAPLTTVATS